MARELGKTYTEYVRETTPLQHRVWVEWLALEMNTPTKDNYYAMQIAQALLRVRDINKLKIPFKRAKRRTGRGRKRRGPDYEIVMAQQGIIAAFGGTYDRSKISKAEQERIDALPLAEAAAERRRLAKEAKERAEKEKAARGQE